MTGLTWQVVLEKNEVDLELLTDIDMLLIVEKVIRGRICHTINRSASVKKYERLWSQKRIIKSLNIGMQTMYINWQCHKSCLEMTLMLIYVEGGG